jgi:SAM-dependent methyltransferase
VRGWRDALFAILWKATRTLERAQRASMHLAVGTLALRDLRSAIANAWKPFSASEAEILSGLMPWERLLFGRFLKPEDRILVVGCGTGRDLIALLKLGYRAEGLDVVADAITLARQMLEREGLSAALYTGPVEAVTLPGSFDAIIFSWCCYGYIPQADTRIGVLRKVKAHLNPGGRVLISYSPADRPPRPLSIVFARFAARLTRSDWHPELGDRFGATARDRQAIHYQHEFWEGELEKEARSAGLTVVFHERPNLGTAVLMA